MGKGFYFKAVRLGVVGVRSDWSNIDLLIAHVKGCSTCEKVRSLLTHSGGRGEAGTYKIGPQIRMCAPAAKLWSKIQEEELRKLKRAG